MSRVHDTTVIVGEAPVGERSARHPPRSRPARSLAWRSWVEKRAAGLSPPGPAPTTRRLLLISYQFPPTGGSGVQRPAKLVKCLPSLGWQVEVLAAGHQRFPWHDPSLLEGIPSTGCIHRVAGLEPACLARRVASAARAVIGEDRARWIEDRVYWRLVRWTARVGRGNGEEFWVPAVVRAALGLHRRRPFDAVLSTGPPHFAHRAALRFQAAAGVPWLADLRDPLVSDFSRTPTGAVERTRLRGLERAILARASLVLTTCPSLADDLRRRYPARAADEIRAITNGFDHDDLRAMLRDDSDVPAASHGYGSSIETRSRRPEGPPSECLFVAAGALYGRREIDKLVVPLGRVLARHPEWSGRVRLILAGSIDARQHQRWRQDRPDWLMLAGYLDHAAALRLCASAACAIVMVPDCRHGRLSIPGKTFELIALPTHVLALAPDGSDTADVVRRAGASTIVPLESPARVAEALERIIAGHFTGRLERERDWPQLERYSRLAVAERFAEALDHVFRSRP